MDFPILDKDVVSGRIVDWSNCTIRSLTGCHKRNGFDMGFFFYFGSDQKCGCTDYDHKEGQRKNKYSDENHLSPVARPHIFPLACVFEGTLRIFHFFATFFHQSSFDRI